MAKTRLAVLLSGRGSNFLAIHGACAKDVVPAEVVVVVSNRSAAPGLDRALLEESLAQEYAEHRAVVGALAARKPDLAAQKAMEHVLHLGRDLESLLQIPGELIKEKERQTLAFTKSS